VKAVGELETGLTADFGGRRHPYDPPPANVCQCESGISPVASTSRAAGWHPRPAGSSSTAAGTDESAVFRTRSTVGWSMHSQMTVRQGRIATAMAF
jgi:hypothetical protein